MRMYNTEPKNHCRKSIIWLALKVRLKDITDSRIEDKTKRLELLIMIPVNVNVCTTRTTVEHPYRNETCKINYGLCLYRKTLQIYLNFKV